MKMFNNNSVTTKQFHNNKMVRHIKDKIEENDNIVTKVLDFAGYSKGFLFFYCETKGGPKCIVGVYRDNFEENHKYRLIGHKEWNELGTEPYEKGEFEE